VAEQKKISQSKLSRLADVAPKTMQGIWQDRQKNVELLTLQKLAKALGVTIKDLFEEFPDTDSSCS
jgi:DNA-binding Xre family transcriptional regulator